MIDEIIPKIKDKKVILFGETHGTKEIPELLSIFFNSLSKSEEFDLCLEIPNEFQEQINSYLDYGDYQILKSIQFFSKEHTLDGRNSKEYVDLIKTIYHINSENNKNIKISCVFPSYSKDQEEVEKGISENILNASKHKKTFSILGNIHASKKEIDIVGNKITPAGFLIHQKLNGEVFSILLSPKEGKIFNNEIKEVGFQEEDPFERNFDYVYKLDRVTPCSFL